MLIFSVGLDLGLAGPNHQDVLIGILGHGDDTACVGEAGA